MNSVRELYKIEQLPILQNRLYDTEHEAKNCPSSDLRLIEDLKTGLVYNDNFSSESAQYDESYQNEQGVSSSFRHHLIKVCNIVESYLGKKKIVEIGCGKGFFLQMLEKRGCNIVGFDPAYEGDNPSVNKSYFTNRIGLNANGIVLRHVLEHISDPIDFLIRIRDANSGQGKVYIEVPCFEWICKHRAWYDVYNEHVNYFRISDFSRIFDNIHKSGRLFNDQYIYVVAELGSLKNPKYDDKTRVLFPRDFTDSLKNERIVKRPKYSIVWGGSSKGVIFSLLKQRMRSPVDAVIDINPVKQGKYLPGTGLCVKAPENALNVIPSDTTIYVMNTNYYDEIKKIAGINLNYIRIENE